MRKIGEGVYSHAFLDDNQTVILSGKCDDSYAWYQRLKSDLDTIDGKITVVQIPRALEIIAPGPAHPNGALRLSYVPGVELKKCADTLTPEMRKAIGKTLAMFIREIQAIHTAGDKDHEIQINNNKLARSLVALVPFMTAVENERLGSIAKLYTEFMQRTPFTLTHGDLQKENLMIDPDGKLTGIVDFGNMEYYVPHVEFCAPYGFDKTVYDAMVAEYFPGGAPGEFLHGVILTALVRQVRFFRTTIGWGAAARQKEIDHIRRLMNELGA